MEAAMKRFLLSAAMIGLCTHAWAYDGPYPPLEEERAPEHVPASPPQQASPEWRVASGSRPKPKDPHERGLQLGGPRFGMTYISGGGFQKLQETVDKAKPGTKLEPFMTHFGWQIEYRMFKTEQGL